MTTPAELREQLDAQRLRLQDAGPTVWLDVWQATAELAEQALAGWKAAEERARLATVSPEIHRLLNRNSHLAAERDAGEKLLKMADILAKHCRLVEPEYGDVHVALTQYIRMREGT